MTKRSRGSAKGKRSGKRKRTAIVALIVAACIVASFVSYGLAYRGVVDFTFGGKNEVRQSYRLAAMSKYEPSAIDLTHIRIRNTGSTGITVTVTLHALNAVVSTAYSGPYSDTSDVQIYLPAGGGDQVITFYLTLPQQVSTFTLSVAVARVFDFSSIATFATSSFTSIQPNTPTTLIYAQEPANPDAYQLTNQY